MLVLSACHSLYMTGLGCLLVQQQVGTLAESSFAFAIGAACRLYELDDAV